LSTGLALAGIIVIESMTAIPAITDIHNSVLVIDFGYDLLYLELDCCQNQKITIQVFLKK
jgi:hypothetical protein